MAVSICLASAPLDSLSRALRNAWKLVAAETFSGERAFGPHNSTISTQISRRGPNSFRETPRARSALRGELSRDWWAVMSGGWRTGWPNSGPLTPLAKRHPKPLPFLRKIGFVLPDRLNLRGLLVEIFVFQAFHQSTSCSVSSRSGPSLVAVEFPELRQRRSDCFRPGQLIGRAAEGRAYFAR